MTDRAITADLLARLKRHYIKPGQPMPGGIFVPEVGQNGSWGRAGRCDAIYVGFTSTSGRILVGHEVKASRADWLTELSKPGKADAWADQCHEWWLVSAPGVVREGELPAGWGHMLPGTSRTRMKVVQRPVRKDPAEHTPSWDAARSIMARQDTLRAQAIEDGRRKAHVDAAKDVDERVARQVARSSGTSEVERLQDRLRRSAEKSEAIERALGVSIDVSDRPRSYPGNLPVARLADLAPVVHDLAATEEVHTALVGGWGSAEKALEEALRQVREAAMATAPGGAPQ